MNELPVAVIGAGCAGVAAAYSAVRAGARVLVLHGAAGASSLYSGVVDGPAPDADVTSLAAALGLVAGAETRAIASREGVVRSARGRQSALLDLSALAGRRVALADFGRDDWDARLLARSFEGSAWARATGTRFVAVRVPALADGSERRIPAYDLAARFDAADRADALTAALAAAGSDADAWLTGPFLGVATDVAARLSSALARPVGETSSAPGGAAGARFDARRDALLAELGVEVVRARVTAIRPSGVGCALELEGGATRAARAVVLALGGVTSGGVELASGTGAPGHAFRLSVAAPVELELDGVICDAGSSLSGVSFARHGLGALERVGVRTSAGVVAAADRPIYAAGDVRSGSGRDVISALASGIAAGRAAAATG